MRGSATPGRPLGKPVSDNNCKSVNHKRWHLPFWLLRDFWILNFWSFMSRSGLQTRTMTWHLMKMITMPDGYKYTKKDEVIKQFQEEARAAAKRPAPAPAEPLAKKEQPSISSSLLLTPTSREREREKIPLREHGPYAAGARHRFLRAS